MSLWNRAPRQVYEVHGEDDYVTHDDATPNECAAPQLDTSVVSSPRSGGVLGLALLVVVTLGAVALVLLALSHAPAGRHTVAERQVPSGDSHRSFPGPSTTAPPEVHRPTHSKRHVRADIFQVTRPRRRNRRIAGGHVETPTIVIAPPGGQPSGAPARGEFDFER
jgi:hypothetical protein